MNNEQLLDAVVRKQVSVFSISDEKVRQLFILLLQKVRQR
jgi:hypothetical protein